MHVHVGGRGQSLELYLRCHPFCFFTNLFLFYLYEYIAYMYISEPTSYSARGGQKRASDPLELELQAVVICYVGAGN